MLTTLLWSGELAKGQIAVQEALKKQCFRTQSFITGGPRKNIPQAARCWNWVAMKESSVLAAWGKYSWVGDQRKQLVRQMDPIFASTWFFIIFFFLNWDPWKTVVCILDHGQLLTCVLFLFEMEHVSSFQASLHSLHRLFAEAQDIERREEYRGHWECEWLSPCLPSSNFSDACLSHNDNTPAVLLKSIMSNILQACLWNDSQLPLVLS